MAEEKKEIKMEDVKARAEEKKCLVQQSLVFVNEFLAGPMCARCFPCMMGSYEVKVRLQKLEEGTAAEDDLIKTKRILSDMFFGSMCKKGKDTAKFIMDHIDSDEFRSHVSQACTNKECFGLIRYTIIPEKCTMCGICKDACMYDAIIGEKKKPYLSGYRPFEIVQKRCTKCGDCLKVCPYDAIVVLTGDEKIVTEELAQTAKE